MAEIDASQTTRLVESGKIGRLHHPSYESVRRQKDSVGLEGSATETKNNNPSEYKQLSAKRKYILVMCTIATFLGACAFALLGPFYALEAEKKGMSTFLTGVVFGIFNFVIFLSSPFFGNYLTKIGPKFAYCAGIFVSGVCNILFGTLIKCPSGTPFIAMSIVVRCVEALGVAAFNTSIFAIVSYEFPSNIGFVFGVLEMGAGMGFLVGPALGGALYELGGYGLPFYTVGGLVLLNGVMTYKFLPDPRTLKEKREGSMLTLLRSPLVIVALIGIFTGILGITTIDATLAKRLEPFGLSAGLISLFFMISSLMYSSMSLIWGYLTDKRDIQGLLIIFGQLLYGLGYLILGPSLLFPFIPDTLWSASVGLVCVGLSLGCLVIPTMKCVIKGAFELNFKDNLDTYAMASGLFNSFNTLGGSVGPVGSAALVDAYGYPIGYTFIGLFGILTMFISITFFSLRYYRKKKGAAPLEESLNPIATDGKRLYRRTSSL